MVPSASFALRFRRTLLVGTVLAWSAAVVLLCAGPFLEWVVVIVPTPLFTLELFHLDRWLGDAEAWSVGGCVLLGTLLGSQWLFLRPRGEWLSRLAEEGRPMRGAVVAAAFVVTLVSAGFLFTLLQLCDGLKGLDPFWPVEIGMLGLWALWTLIFWVHWRGGTRYEQLRRMTRRLFAGSLLELLVAIPADVWAAKRDDCYCARGSYWGVCLGGAGLLWAFGPGIVLLLLREKVERERRAGLDPNLATAARHDP